MSTLNPHSMEPTHGLGAGQGGLPPRSVFGPVPEMSPGGRAFGDSSSSVSLPFSAPVGVVLEPVRPYGWATVGAGLARTPVLVAAIGFGLAHLVDDGASAAPSIGLAVSSAVWITLAVVAIPVYLLWMSRAVANLPRLRASLDPPRVSSVWPSHLIPVLGLGWGWSVARRLSLNSRPDLIPGRLGTLGTYDAPLAGWVYLAMVTTMTLVGLALVLIAGSIFAGWSLDSRWWDAVLALAAASDLTQIVLGTILVGRTTFDQLRRARVLD